MATTKTRRIPEETITGSKTGSNETTRQGAGQVRMAVGEAAASAQEKGKNLISRAKDEAQSYFEDKRDALASTIVDVADATRQVAQTLRGRDDAMIARYTESAADGAEELSRYVRSLRPAEILRSIEDTARKQPALVFGGLFVAGLAISRFLRASERSLHSDDEQFQATPAGFRTPSGQTPMTMTGSQHRRHADGNRTDD
jgi:hypothetical protein